MRNILIVIQVAVVLFLARFCGSDKVVHSTDHTPTRKIKAHLVSNSKHPSPVVKPPIVNSQELLDFLNGFTDTRMMDFEEGKLAEEKGTTKEIKSYGELMEEDQGKMLNEIKSIAKNRDIKLEQKISDKKLEALTEIKLLKGRNFDRKFVKMMRIDHRRDIRKLKRATKSKEPEVKRIAEKYLPIVKSHLDKLKQL